MNASSGPAAEVFEPQSLALTKPTGQGKSWQTPFSKSHVHVAQAAAGHAGWHKVGGHEETPSPKTRQKSCDSFLQSRKAAKVSLLPKTSGLC